MSMNRIVQKFGSQTPPQLKTKEDKDLLIEVWFANMNILNISTLNIFNLTKDLLIEVWFANMRPDTLWDEET